MAKKGIDVSHYQGSVDFNKVKAAGYEFVIIRAGYGKYSSQKDGRFEENYKKARAAGLGVGAYWYSYAVSAAEAKQEAAICLEAIEGKQFDYPIYFDLEEQKAFAKGRAVCSDMVKAFCGALESAGYFAGLYISRSPLQSYITTEVANRYALWIAEYGSKCSYGGSYGMWQYSSKGKVNGISGNVDMDECYVDYPAIVKAAGLNGYTKPKPEPTPAPKGDVNGDGKLDVSDVTAIAAQVKGVKPLKDPAAGDVNGDGKVDSADVTEAAARVKGNK